ncbi:serine hydrolase [Syntrophaceticus schinkii]|jgi:beta-lactamase class A|uniref:Beta-lactamase (Modular protein) n=1 Tax=Syntrophaceticus schinkii TaxID=499207 RepID=A0A0B7MNK9_9FIRM|nr:serine hydrolase [Syntrophaceticus schinkii]CEO89282.1 Beta-lactamase (modular protein) [Syntrophaceticus schinkii]
MPKFYKFLIILCCFFFCSSNAWAMSSVSYRSLEDEIIDLTAQEQGTYGVYVIDLTTHQVCGVNEDTVFHAASTFKLPLNIYLFQQIADGQIDPQTKLTYYSKHYEGGTGILQNKKYGSSYTIQELAKYSIIYSDNVATNMLLGYLGRPNVKKMMADMGGIVVDNSANTTCPRDMALYMDALVEFNKEHPDQGAILLTHLKNTVFNDRIPTLLPPDTEVAHKTGNWPATGSYHDVGLVEHPSHPYTIALFSKNVSSSAHAYHVLQRLSRLVYDAQSGLIEMELVVNDQPLITDIPSILASDTVYLPLSSSLADSLDAIVHWDEQENCVQIQGEHDVVLYPGQTKMLWDNTLLYSKLPIEVVAGHLMVPLEIITDMFEVSATLETTTNTVYITSNPEVEQPPEQSLPDISSYGKQLLVPLFLIFVLGCCLIMIRKK